MLKAKNKIFPGVILLFLAVLSALYLTHSKPAYAVFPTANVLDNFNRADTTSLGGSTSSSGNAWASTLIQDNPPVNLGISGNQMYLSSSSANNAYLNTQFGPDSEIYTDVPVVPANGQYIGLYARIQQPGSSAFDMYALIYFHNTSGNATWALRRYDNGVSTQLGGSSLSSPAISAGDSIGLEVTGTGANVTVTAYHKTGGVWSTVGSRTDSDANRITSAGYLGVEIDSLSTASTRLDNLRGGAVVTNQSPATPTNSLPASNATNVSVTPQFNLSTTDPDSDYLRYKIDVCSDASCSTIVRTIDQTTDQTGWSGQDAQSNTAYNSGSTASYTYQLPALNLSTQYWWRSYAIDPGGTNIFSSPTAVLSFTTGSATTTPSGSSPSSSNVSSTGSFGK